MTIHRQSELKHEAPMVIGFSPVFRLSLDRTVSMESAMSAKVIPVGIPRKTLVHLNSARI